MGRRPLEKGYRITKVGKCSSQHIQTQLQRGLKNDHLPANNGLVLVPLHQIATVDQVNEKEVCVKSGWKCLDGVTD